MLRSIARASPFVPLAIVCLCASASAAGALAIAGSTTLFPFVRDAAAAYQAAHPELTITVTGGGSRAAIVQLDAKQIDMAATDAAPSGTDLVDHRVAVIGFAIAVNPGSGVSSLTRDQLRGVLDGAVTNYKQVGGNDVPVALVNRPQSSGIRELLAERIMRGKPIVETGATDDGTSSLVDDLKSNPGAIGYGAFGGLRDAGLTLLAIDGIAATDDGVTAGRYPLWAYEHLVTNGPATPDESRFLAYLQTNRTLLRRYGYIPVQDMRVAPPAP
jgi:phosphate transport system substrate-binding protein